MAKSEKLTPMMEQYMEVKNNLPPNTLLLFRLGDFYEMFEEDAETGAALLGITLTSRHGCPMAGIPYHAAEGYIAKALAAGKKIAICDQMETPKPGKLVKRSLTRIITPGTVLEANHVEAARNRFLLAVDLEKNRMHAAWLDLSTGDFFVAADETAASLMPVFTAIDPREVILAEGVRAAWVEKDGKSQDEQRLQEFCRERLVSELPGFHFEREAGARSVMETLGVLNLEGFGISKGDRSLGCAGALLHYVSDNLCAQPANLHRLQRYSSAKSLILDPATLRNLEIFQSASNSRDGSLLAAMDGTVTAAGARLLEQYLATATLDLDEIKRRQNCVQDLVEEPALASRLQESLRKVRDLNRILGRLQNRIRNPRELGGVRDTLQQLPLLREHLGEMAGNAMPSVGIRLSDFPELRDLLERSLLDELPGQLQDGGFIKPGYDDELDRLTSLTTDNKTWLSDLERAEQQRTGIKNLRIRFNNAFGYFIEVTKANLKLVPPDYIRKQTTVNTERFYTEALKEKEKEIFHAEEKAKARENELFADLVLRILDHAPKLRETADALAELDVFLGWASLAREWNYCKPHLDRSRILEIEEGRHPVVEQTLRDEKHGLGGSFSFVPNDTFLDAENVQIMLLTGPNMAGKSTYIRQVALLTLMAQSGAWIPARSARIGLVDRIFSRVGASDELARGNSTFMVEMNETANILNNSTDRSLVILDEIGRGTSTYDGLSIAWAVIEHLHADSKCGPRTLFATHYHELTRLGDSLARLRNFCVAVKEWNDEIVFIRQVVPGAADRSYGIQVARLAGLPPPVIRRAKEILEHLESDDSSGEALSRGKGKAPAPSHHQIEPNQKKDDGQMHLF